MQNALFAELREDCLRASASQPEVRAGLGLQHIAVTGGTGFLGSWIAETVAALNDEYRLGITLDLYARNTQDWSQRYPHLSGRSDITLRSQDVRSPFELARNTNLVVHAAGVPNNRVHASDPRRVQQTIVQGLTNTLEAASHLDNLTRFLNVSSCLVSGRPTRQGPLAETDSFALPAGQLHSVYADAKHSAESVAAIYRSQFRLPVTTVRPFTFAGAYQELDRPWAINSFMRDLLTGGEIRLHGDGTARRSYLYGSDAAWWTLAALVKGADGMVCNIGSPHEVTHLELVNLMGMTISPKPKILLNTAPAKQVRGDDLYPDVSATFRNLGVSITCSLDQTIDKSWRWFSRANA